LVCGETIGSVSRRGAARRCTHDSAAFTAARAGKPSNIR
jgi:hypothetical protein